jgi:uncharacterized protein DUF5666
MRYRISMAAAVGLALLGLGGSASADEKMIGNLAAVDTAAKTFSVQETGAADSTTFSVDGKTEIREGREKLDLASLQTGRSVKVTYVQANGVALAHRVEVSMPLGADHSTPIPARANQTR